MFLVKEVAGVSSILYQTETYWADNTDYNFYAGRSGNDISFSLNGRRQDFRFNGEIFSAEIDLKPGANEIRIVAVNKDGVDEDPVQVFYEQITQRADGNFFKPFNPSTFLLISAGHDGVYGTEDDIYNFERN